MIHDLGWDNDKELVKAKENGIERQLFPELNENEKKIVELLQKNNDLQMNTISMLTGLPIPATSSALFNMEMLGVVKLMAGGMYHLLG